MFNEKKREAFETPNNEYSSTVCRKNITDLDFERTFLQIRKPGNL